VAGFDADVRYAFNTGAGQLTPSVALSNIYKWQSSLVPNAPLIDYVSQAGGNPGWAPRWKGTAALGWKQGPLSMDLAGRYIGRYKDYQFLAPNSNELGNFWLVDLNARWDLGKALARNNRWLAGASVALGAVNLFDKTPPFSYGSPPYDWSQYDLRGRLLYIRTVSSGDCHQKCRGRPSDQQPR